MCVFVCSSFCSLLGTHLNNGKFNFWVLNLNSCLRYVIHNECISMQWPNKECCFMYVADIASAGV